MYKIVNLISIIIVSTFFFKILSYYFSNSNIKYINFNRSNIESILENKISNIPILKDDTYNIIEFNSSLSEEIKNNEPRSFWNLLKSK
jgi:hypothetical protein